MAEARSNKPPAMQGKYGAMTPQKAATSDETAEAAAEALMRPRDTAISDEIQRELEAAMSQAVEVAERLEELERAIRSDTVKTKRLAKLMASMEPDSEEFAAKEADLTLVKRRLKTNKAAFLSDTVESKRVESRLGNIERMRLDTKIKEARCREELSQSHSVGATALFAMYRGRVRPTDRKSVSIDTTLKSRVDACDVIGFLHRFDTILQGANADANMQLIDVYSNWLKDIYDGSTDFPQWLATQAQTQKAYSSIRGHGDDTVQVSTMRRLIEGCDVLNPLLFDWSLHPHTIPKDFDGIHRELTDFYSAHRAMFVSAAKSKGKTAKQSEVNAFAVTNTKYGKATGGGGKGNEGSNKPTGTCNIWATTGACKFGDRCRYLHTGGKSGGAAASGTDGKRSGGDNRLNVCRDMLMTGKCAIGDDCRWKTSHDSAKAAHTQLERSTGK